MKIHLKGTPADRLTLCGIFVKERWVLRQSALRHAEGTVCKICSIVAAKLDSAEIIKSRSKNA